MQWTFVLFASAIIALLVTMTILTWSRTRRNIVLLSRFNVGTTEDGTRLDQAFVRGLVDRRIIALPPGSHVKQVSTTTTEALVEATREQLRLGERYFVGVLTSGDVQALLPLAQEHPDAMFISTASTAASLRTPDNVFRTANPDVLFMPYLQTILAETFPTRTPSDWTVVYDTASVWATQLQTQFSTALPGCTITSSWSDVPAAPPANTGLIVLTEHDDMVVPELTGRTWHAGTPVVFGDPSAYSRTWVTNPAFTTERPANINLFAFGSLKILVSSTAARNIVGAPVPPNVCNLLLACRVALQAALIEAQLVAEGVSRRVLAGGRVVEEVQHSRSVDLGTGMFDSNGDRVDIEVGLIGWFPEGVPGTDDANPSWQVVSTAGKHATVGGFVASLYDALE